LGAIDADAHVIETVQTWYLEGDERRFTPQLMTQTFGGELPNNEGIAVRDFWVIEGRARGKDRNVGTNTPQESREMLRGWAAIRAHEERFGTSIRTASPDGLNGNGTKCTSNCMQRGLLCRRHPVRTGVYHAVAHIGKLLHKGSL
jgi:hypothetical protein